MSRFLPFTAGVIVSATAYSLFSSQIEHDAKHARRQLSHMSTNLLKAANEPTQTESRVSSAQPSVFGQVFGTSTTELFGTNSYRGTWNSAAEKWNSGIRSAAAYLTGEHL
ncbi:hypothetical protein CcCBS67573_g06465 [Chytriomyces confervae]|uniref:Uncharacterized protein n=1 Tax=Chytriomyces confervae TaxID=246404 RepID=A0A507F4W8_9FUNG|nr:hypothetical protein CcCBS67573_g06465 [Chytriomyces confervae]